MAYYTGPSYGPKDGMAYTTVMPRDGFQYKYGEDGTRYSVPIVGKPTTPDGGGKIDKSSDPATDQEIRDAGFKYVPQQKYLQNPFELSTPPDTTPDGGITNTNAFANSGDNGQQFYTGGTNNLISDFQSSIDDRQNRLNKPIDTSTFMGKIKGFMKPQSSDQIMAKGYQPQMKLGFLANLLPDKYGTLPRADQAFIAQNMGYTGPTVFGQNIGNQDIFGTNVRSAFGNYGERVGVEATNLGAQLGGRLSDKYGAEFDEETGMFIGPNAAKANEMTKMMRAKLGFYRAKQIERDNLKKESLVGQMKRDKEAGAAGKSDSQDQSRTGSSGRRPGSGGNVERRDSGPDRNTDSGGTTYDSGGREGFGYGLKEGGRAGYFFGGRVNYKIGGVVNPDGRKGFFQGALADTKEGKSMSPGTDASGGFRGGDNDGGASDNPPVTVVNNNPIDISTITKSVGDYEIPVGIEALMANKGRLQAVLNADNVLDKNLGAEFTYDKGPFSINAYADMDGDKSLNANYTRNNSNYSFDLNDGGGQLKFTRTFANGGLASIL